MRGIFLFMAAALLAPACASAQPLPAKNLTALFDAVQRLGTDSELRGDIADRLGFGEHPLAIKDLVISANGVQHAANAFKVSDKSYLLFDSHLYAPEVYIFVKNTDGTLAAGIHGEQYQPITSAIGMRPSDGLLVIEAEEGFWFQWLADGAKAPAPVN
jgi:hypothetical protein